MSEKSLTDEMRDIAGALWHPNQAHKRATELLNKAADIIAADRTRIEAFRPVASAITSCMYAAPEIMDEKLERLFNAFTAYRKEYPDA